MRSIELQKRYLEKIKNKIEDQCFEIEIFENAELKIPVLKIQETLNHKKTAYIFFSVDCQNAALSLLMENDGIMSCNELRFLEAFYPKRSKFTLFDYNAVVIKGIIMPFMISSKQKHMEYKDAFKKLNSIEIELLQEHRQNYLLKTFQNGMTIGLSMIDASSIFNPNSKNIKCELFERALDIHTQAKIVRSKKITI